MFTAPLPIELPICTLGPSFPRGTPTKKVSSVEVNIPIRLRTHLNGINPRSIAREFGIPLPLIIGKNFINKKDKIAIVAAPRRRIGKKFGLFLTDVYTKLEKSCTYFAAILKMNIIIPVIIPVRQESDRPGSKYFFVSICFGTFLANFLQKVQK